MTDLTDLTDLTDRPLEVRRDLTDHEQMLDAQSQCVPCKLCGGSAVISDAGLGAGYYIRCGNSLSMRDSKGCMLDERRLGGWAYNVMDWWNRLHAAHSLETLTQENARLEKDRGSAIKWANQSVSMLQDTFFPVAEALRDLEAYLAHTPHHNAPEAAAARKVLRAFDACEVPPAPARKALGGGDANQA